MRGRGWIVVAAVNAAVVMVALGFVAGRASRDDAPGAFAGVVIHPPFQDRFVCVDHPEGQLSSVGDALGSDCFVVRFDGGPMGKFPRVYGGDGARNEDWVGWDKPVLAPFDAVVESTSESAGGTNVAGHIGEGRSTSIVFRRGDGVRLLYAHVQGVAVREGDHVKAGDLVAHVGNNGQAWFPHVHLGAWHGDEPLQITMDLAALGKIQGFQS